MCEPRNGKRQRGEEGEDSPLQRVTRCSRAPASFERHFVYRLSSTTVASAQERQLTLDALVLANGLCVLTFPVDSLSRLDPKNTSYSVVFDAASDAMEIKGKRKKGARKVKSGFQVCSLVGGPGAPLALLSPVAGHLLEINKNVERDAELLLSQPQGVGYIAVIFPDGEIPSLENGGVVKPRNNVCHAFAASGTCSRGDVCKFSHKIQT